jgi:hypothetical protein
MNGSAAPSTSQATAANGANATVAATSATAVVAWVSRAPATSVFQ